jgi:predicted sugar kinase
MTRVKNSLEEIRVQMELMRSDAADLSADRIGRMKETVLIRYAEAKASGYVKIADFKEELQKRFAALQGIGFTKPEFLSIGDRLKEIKVPELSTKKFRERLQREILKRNPDATSKKFADAIRELKDSMRLR